MADITLLDGGLGQEIVKRFGAPATPLWSTQIMIDAPERVLDVQRTFAEAGATVLTTNSYALHESRLEPVGLTERLPELIRTSVELANEAKVDPAHRVAAGIGPLMASYRPDLDPGADVAAPKIREIAQMLAENSDLFLVETISSVSEGEGVLRGTQGLGLPVWASFSTSDEDGLKLRSGEALADITPLIETYKPDAILLNCTRPEMMREGLDVIRKFGIPFGAYANGFTKISDGFLKDRPTVDALTARTDLSPEGYADYAMSWIEQGATIVGGCCEVGPEHIKAIAERLKAAGHTIV